MACTTDVQISCQGYHAGWLWLTSFSMRPPDQVQWQPAHVAVQHKHAQTYMLSLQVPDRCMQQQQQPTPLWSGCGARAAWQTASVFFLRARSGGWASEQHRCRARPTSAALLRQAAQVLALHFWVVVAAHFVIACQSAITPIVNGRAHCTELYRQLQSISVYDLTTVQALSAEAPFMPQPANSIMAQVKA